MRQLSALDGNIYTSKLLDVVVPDVNRGEKFNYLFIVMDCSASDLKKVLSSGTGIDFGEHHVLCVLYNTLCGLQFLHSANVMHRDIKPANILIEPDCQVKLCDFGHACVGQASDGEVDLHSVQAFYQEKQKSPFSNLPWGHGAMRLKFQVDVSSLLRREESNILQDIKQYGNRRRTFGVVGICSCTRCPDVSKAYEEFLEASRMYPNACALRCLMNTGKFPT